MLKIKDKIKKYKEKLYWKRRAKKWEKFKSNNEKMECGLIKKTKYYTPQLWEYDCINCCCYKDFFLINTVACI